MIIKTDKLDLSEYSEDIIVDIQYVIEQHNTYYLIFLKTKEKNIFKHPQIWRL